MHGCRSLSCFKHNTDVDVCQGGGGGYDVWYWGRRRFRYQLIQKRKTHRRILSPPWCCFRLQCDQGTTDMSTPAAYCLRLLPPSYCQIKLHRVSTSSEIVIPLDCLVGSLVAETEDFFGWAFVLFILRCVCVGRCIGSVQTDTGGDVTVVCQTNKKI